MFTSRQQLTLQAMLDRIIPPDDDPGAWEAGVGTYLFQQYRQEFVEIVSTYALGLDCLECEALAAYDHSFSELSPTEQDAVLTRLETGQTVTAWPLNPRRFFALAVQHAMEGFYADPGNGGNKNGVAWNMIGYQVTG